MFAEIFDSSATAALQCSTHLPKPLSCIILSYLTTSACGKEVLLLTLVEACVIGFPPSFASLSSSSSLFYCRWVDCRASALARERRRQETMTPGFSGYSCDCDVTGGAEGSADRWFTHRFSVLVDVVEAVFPMHFRDNPDSSHSVLSYSALTYQACSPSLLP